MISTTHPQGFPRDIHIFSGVDRKKGYVLRFFALFRFIRNRKLIPYYMLFTYLICLHSKLSMTGSMKMPSRIRTWGGLGGRLDMNNKSIILIFIFSVFVASCASTPIPPRADNFSFVYKDFGCGPMPYYVLDSTNETLKHSPVGNTNEYIYPFALTDDELESIYKKAISIGFFEYTSPFVVPEDQMLGYQLPASNYDLYLINGEKSNLVGWTDGIMAKPSYKAFKNLQELQELIDAIIQSREIRLPVPSAGCA